MYGMDAGMGGKMRSIAMKKAGKKKSKTSKIGDMLDKKEMKQAPRKPFVERFERVEPKKKPFVERFTRRGAPRGAK